MELIKDIENISEPLKNSVVTIGNFDGVHKGHQYLLGKVIEKAKSIDGTSVAITFEPHPVKVLKKSGQLPHITMYEQKVELISRTGIDVLVSIPFTKEFASLSADWFVEDLLLNRIGMKVIITGEDYTFGKGREGNVGFLKKYGEKYDFEVITGDWQKTAGTGENRISSTIIRQTVMDGRVEDAVAQLGRYYQIRGQVVRGRDRGGKSLGFPTANIFLQDELSPKNGVYAVTVESGSDIYKGVANIGYSPTFDDHQFTVEVHILDFNKDIYDRTIRVNFVSRLRDEKKFSGISELSDQINRDIDKARKILA